MHGRASLPDRPRRLPVAVVLRREGAVEGERNWNASGVRIAERNWHAFSWKANPNLRLAQMVAAALGGLAMNIKARLTRKLLEGVRADLSRPHAFAAERVGFLFGRLGTAGPDSLLVIMTGYEPLGDDRYIDDPRSGVRIDSQAIRGAMQGVLDRGEGVLHVHMHEWPGRPRLSRMDAEEIPRIVTGFRRAGPAYAHGIFLLHAEECAAWVWLPGEDEAVVAEAVSVVGYSLQVFREDAR